jgi:hypothetical protein
MSFCSYNQYDMADCRVLNSFFCKAHQQQIPLDGMHAVFGQPCFVTWEKPWKNIVWHDHIAHCIGEIIPIR